MLFSPPPYVIHLISNLGSTQPQVLKLASGITFLSYVSGPWHSHPLVREDTGVQQGLPFKSRLRALTGVAQKVGRHPAKRNVSGWIPGHQSPVGAHVTGN